jgi:hypothetical protein
LGPSWILVDLRGVVSYPIDRLIFGSKALNPALVALVIPDDHMPLGSPLSGKGSMTGFSSESTMRAICAPGRQVSSGVMGCLVQTDPLPNGVHLIDPKTGKVLSEEKD